MRFARKLAPRIASWALVLVVLLSMVPQKVHAQDWTLEDLPQELVLVTAAEAKSVGFYANWDAPTYAEPPDEKAVLAAGIELSTSDPICTWVKVADENLSQASTSNFGMKVVPDAFSGQFVITRSSTGINQSVIEITARVTAETDFEYAFVRYYSRSRGTTFQGNIKTRLTQDGVFDERTDWGATTNWNRYEVVFTRDKTYNKEVKFRVEVNFGQTSGEFQLDQMGIAICSNPPLVAPEPSVPDEIGNLYGSLFIYGGLLYNHGTSAAIALAEGGVKSYKRCWEEGLCHTILNRNWSLGGNPYGVTEGIYLGDELWASLKSDESWYHAGRVATTRCFDEGVCMKQIAQLETKLAAQIRQNAPAKNIQATTDLLKLLQGKLAYFRDVNARGLAEWLKTPMNLVFEMKPSEMSRTFDGGRYQYVKDGIMQWSRLRGIEFPDGTDVELAKSVYRQLVTNGAPRTIKVVIGDIQVQIGYWDRWAGWLRNYAVPNLISWGGSAGLYVYTTLRAGATVAAEYVPYIAGAVLAADATADFAIYFSLTDESSLNVLEYAVSESLITQVLSDWDVIDTYPKSTIGTSGYATLQFEIPETKEWLIDYHLNEVSFTHPHITSVQGWKVDHVETDIGLWLKKDNGIELFMPFDGTTTYSMVLMDASWGMVIVDFTFSLVRWSSDLGEAEIVVTFTGFRTPEEYGMCPGWLPPEDAAELDREECYTPEPEPEPEPEPTPTPTPAPSRPSKMYLPILGR